MTLSTVMPYVSSTNANMASFDPDELFLWPREAVRELKRRRRDRDLKQAVETSLSSAGRDIIGALKSPRAVLFRQVATPNHEILRFLRIAKHNNLTPMILEYYGDKFVSAGNVYKRSLGKMPLYQDTGIDGRDIVHYHTVVDFNTYTGKPFSSVYCKNGEPLIKFHHQLMNKLTRFDTRKQCVDATKWFQGMGGHAGNYYEQFLLLFLRHAILFEEVLSTPSEQAFAQDVIIPAFRNIEAKYGLRPLIVELIPKNKSGRIFWDSYPKKTERLVH